MARKVRIDEGLYGKLAQAASAAGYSGTEEFVVHVRTSGEPKALTGALRRAFRHQPPDGPSFHRYSVNVLVDNGASHGAPVIYEDNPTYANLIGRIEHMAELGVLHVADHQVVPGKKFFEWGNGPEGEMWTRILTDEDGPYLELMAGAWSDNQPDYSWLQPYEVKSFEQYWYPFRDIGGVKNANLQAAVNLDVAKDGTAQVGFHTTSAYAAATVTLKLKPCYPELTKEEILEWEDGRAAKLVQAGGGDLAGAQ